MLHFLLCAPAHFGRDRNALGHEIHICRVIIIDLLCKGFIDKNNVSVYTHKDRLFLYTGIFPHVFPLENMGNIHGGIIDLTEYAQCVHIDARKNCSPVLTNMGYDVNKLPYRTHDFFNLCNTMDFVPVSLDKPFVVIHFRILTEYTNDTNDLHMLIEWCRRHHPDIFLVVFMNTPGPSDKRWDNILFTNNLQEYASYLGHEHCRLVISEWSGGGQLAQYLVNTNIYYYFRNYPTNGYELNYGTYYQQANDTEQARVLFPSWDFKKSTKAEIRMFRDIHSLISSTPSL